MLFHAFRVVYTVKEFDSHAKHGQSFKKKIWTYNRVFLCQKSHFRVSWKNVSVHASTRVRTRARPSMRFNRHAGSTGLAREECL